MVNNLYNNSSSYPYCPDIREQLVEAIYEKNNNIISDTNTEDDKFGKFGDDIWNKPMAAEIMAANIKNLPSASNRFKTQKKVIQQCLFS